MTGLAGSGLVLQNNGGDDLLIETAGAGSFTFDTRLEDGGAYAVTVLKQPVDPLQTCTVTNGSDVVRGASVTAPLVECTGQFARFSYVANIFDDSISTLAVDSKTGQLRHRGHVETGDAPVSVTVHPSGRFVYVANQIGFSISKFAIDASTGALQRIGADLALGLRPISVMIDASGQFAYVAASRALKVFAIDEQGELQPHGNDIPLDEGVVSAGMDSSGQFFYASTQATPSIRAFTIEADGSLSPLPAPGTGVSPARIAMSPAGQFVYAANDDATVSAYRIEDIGTLGEIEPVRALSAAPLSIAVDPAGRFVYVSSLDGAITGFPIDAASGALGDPTRRDGGSPFASVTVDPTGRFVFATADGRNTVSTFAIGQADGVLRLVRTVASRFGPSAMAMMRGSHPVIFAPQFAYVANTVSSVSAYRVDPGTGVLQPIAEPAAAIRGPQQIVIDPFGKFIFTAAAGTTTGSVFTHEILPNGLLVERDRRQTTSNFRAVEAHPSGRYVYAANDNPVMLSFAIEPDGGLDTIGLVPIRARPRAIAADPTGRFVYQSGDAADIVTASRVLPDGLLDLIPGGPMADVGSVLSIAVDPSGRFVYAPNARAGTLGAFTIRADGLLEPNGTHDIGGTPHSVAVDPTGRFVYVATPGVGDNADTVLAFRIAADGKVSLIDPGEPIDVPTGAKVLAADPSGAFLYAAGLHGVASFAINPVSGALTPGPVLPRGFLAANSMAITTVLH